MDSVRLDLRLRSCNRISGGFLSLSSKQGNTFISISKSVYLDITFLYVRSVDRPKDISGWISYDFKFLNPQQLTDILHPYEVL